MSDSSCWPEGDLLAFDFETTGVDPCKDVPVSFALVRARGGTVQLRRSSLVDPGREIPPGATAVHGITTARARSEGMALALAVQEVALRVLDASHRGVPLVGMKLDFDLTMLDAQYRRFTGRSLEDEGFCGPVLDALVLDRHFDRYRKGRRTLGDLCTEYGVAIGTAHDAAADAEATLAVLAAMCRRYPELSHAEPSALYRSQVVWHREWAASFTEWRRRKGLSALGERDGLWPIATSGEERPAAAAAM